jgi:hypothetical protein
MYVGGICMINSSKLIHHGIVLIMGGVVAFSVCLKIKTHGDGSIVGRERLFLRILRCAREGNAYEKQRSEEPFCGV